MVYFKVLLNDKRPKADNIYPIEVRVTFNRKNTSIFTGHRINKTLWDDNLQKVKHTAPNAQPLNQSIAEHYGSVQKVALELVQHNNFSFEELKLRIRGGSIIPQITKRSTFADFSKELIKDMFACNETGNAIIYQTASNRLMGYANNSNLKFTDIIYTFLEGFRRKLVQQGIRPNSISNYFRTLRAIYNKAIKAKEVDRSHYPFLDIQVKTERTAKRAIKASELRKLWVLKLRTGSREFHARNYFLLSFALRGASFTDLAYLTAASINKGYLIYKRRKTGAKITVRVLPFIQQLLSNYQELNDNYLLPILPANIDEDGRKAKAVISQWIKTTNKYLTKIAELCGIDDLVTTYVSRRTWAKMAKLMGYSIEMIAEALGHEYGNKITNIYLDNFEQVELDNMNVRVLFTIEPCNAEIQPPYKYVLKHVTNPILSNHLLSMRLKRKLNPFKLVA